MDQDMLKTLAQHNSSWLKERLPLYNYHGFWTSEGIIKGTILAQKDFKADPSDVLLSSSPKTGTTWLKALAYAIVTRDKFDDSNNPLLTTMPHECIPLLETTLDRIHDIPLVSTHMPYTSLPESVVTSDCKIVYIYRNIKDVIVSHYHFARRIVNLPVEDSSFDEAYEDFCNGISFRGPYWDHILGYHIASLERPGRILFLKYEDMKKDPTTYLKSLADFIGYPFTTEEESAGVVEKIINMCSFKNLSNLEVNKKGKLCLKTDVLIDNQLYFRKAKDGDWENYFTEEMKEKIDKLIVEKMSGTGLVLK